MASTTRSREGFHGRRRPLARSAPVPLRRGKSLATLARAMLELIDRRTKYLPTARFEDPRWVMTLELFVAAEEGRDIQISSLCLASGVPPTTALRHIRALETKGLFERRSHARDRRISLIRLTEAARAQVARYLSSMSTSGLVMIEDIPLRTAH